MRFSVIKFPLKNRYVLMRHGETDANKQKLYMGRLDIALNGRGKKQASQVQLPFKPDIIYSSPLKRARKTARIVALDLDIKVKLDERLIEKSGGDIEGRHYQEIATKHPETWDIWKSKPLNFILNARFPNGESDSDVITRVEELILELEKNYSNQCVLLVTHSGVIQAARYLAGKNKNDIYLTPIPACHFEALL